MRDMLNKRLYCQEGSRWRLCPTGCGRKLFVYPCMRFCIKFMVNDNEASRFGNLCPRNFWDIEYEMEQNCVTRNTHSCATVSNYPRSCETLDKLPYALQTPMHCSGIKRSCVVQIWLFIHRKESRDRNVPAFGPNTIIYLLVSERE